MNSKRNHQTVVAVSMAVVLAVGAGAFALLHHAPAPVAPVSATPSDFTADVPLAAAPAAALPSEAVATPAKPSIAAAAPPSVAPVLAAPKVASVRRTPKVNKDTADSYTAGLPEAAVSEPIASLAPAPSVTPAPAIEQVAMAAAAPVDAGAPVDAAAPDSSITAAVKSQLAADSAIQGYEVGVTTTLGVVALSGTVATQAAIDHVRDVAASVKDVKSVDTSGMKVTSG